MKRIGNVYEKIYDIENIRLAHKKASRGKSSYKAIQDVEDNLEEKLYNIHLMLKEETYTVNIDDYEKEVINDKGKLRDLYKLHYYPHRIIQWAIMNILMETFNKHYIHSTYASIKGKGIHTALKDIRNSINGNKDVYCYKMDVKKFYPNINNTILLKMLKHKFKDKQLINLLEKIIFSLGERGLPIGSLLSQYLANYYLSFFDHYCKEKLRLKHYFRYMDDIVVLHLNKAFLHQVHNRFERILNNKFDLQIKSNWQVFPVTRGIDFVGYRIFHNKVILRKRIFRKAKQAFLERNGVSAPSYYGWAIHGTVKTFLKKSQVIKRVRKEWRFDKSRLR